MSEIGVIIFGCVTYFNSSNIAYDLTLSIHSYLYHSKTSEFQLVIWNFRPYCNTLVMCSYLLEHSAKDS